MTNYPAGGSAGLAELEPHKTLEQYVKEVSALLKEAQAYNYSQDDFEERVRSIVVNIYLKALYKSKQRRWTGTE